MPKIKQQDTRHRLNLALNMDDYKKMQAQMTENGHKTITDLVIFRCTQPLQKENISAQLAEQELRHVKENLDRAYTDLEKLERELLETKQELRIANNVIKWHSLPFWLKLGKPKELPNTIK